MNQQLEGLAERLTVRPLARRQALRILVNIWGLSGGGAERVGVTLANALQQQECTVRLATSDHTGPFADRLSPGVQLSHPNTKSHFAALLHIRKQIIDFQPDIILSHQTPRNVLCILARLSLMKRKPARLIVVEHGEMDYNSKQKGLGRKIYYLLAKVLYRFSDSVVSCSDNISRNVEKYVWGLKRHVTTLPNPVIYKELDTLRRQQPMHSWLQQRDLPVFLGAGRLVDQKNFLLLLDAFSQVLKRIPSRLLIIGEGPQRKLLESRVAELGIIEHVALPGFTDNPMAQMQNCDVLVLSSKWEGLPTVAIEAIYCGTQVVSTDNSSGIHEILDNRRLGWIVPVNDVDALSDAMLEALQKPKSPNDLTTQAMLFEENVSARKYLDHFNDVLASETQA